MTVMTTQTQVRASWATTAALLATAAWCTATAQGGPPYDCRCLLELGTPVLPDPWPDCLASTSIVLSGTNGNCQSGNCSFAPGTTKCSYDLDIALVSASNCCFTLKCVSGGTTTVITETCTPALSHTWSNFLTCGQSRIYRVFADDPTSCPANNTSPDCDNEIWYARVRCVSGTDC